MSFIYCMHHQLTKRLKKGRFDLYRNKAKGTKNTEGMRRGGVKTPFTILPEKG